MTTPLERPLSWFRSAFVCAANTFSSSLRRATLPAHPSHLEYTHTRTSANKIHFQRDRPDEILKFEEKTEEKKTTKKKTHRRLHKPYTDKKETFFFYRPIRAYVHRRHTFQVFAIICITAFDTDPFSCGSPLFSFSPQKRGTAVSQLKGILAFRRIKKRISRVE